MASQDNNSDRGSPIVFVETASSKHNLPFRQPDLDVAAPDMHQKRAPVMPLVSSERHKDIAKKLSTNVSGKVDSQSVGIPLTSVKSESKPDEIITMPAQPIPAGPLTSSFADIDRKKVEPEKGDDEDSITSEIAEMRTPEPAYKKATEEEEKWSDDEEASGLPRSESRASRVSRAVRQLLCCGYQLQTPSEDNISTRSGFYNSGI